MRLSAWLVKKAVVEAVIHHMMMIVTVMSASRMHPMVTRANIVEGCSLPSFAVEDVDVSGLEEALGTV